MSVTVMSRLFPLFFFMSEIETLRHSKTFFFLKPVCLQILKSCAVKCRSPCLFLQNRAARVRVGKGDKPVTYEQAHAPHYIGHRKGWLSQHTSE